MKNGLIILGIVALVGIMSLLNTNITGKFTETFYEDYCNPSACKDACGKICTEYRSEIPGKCLSSYIIENGKKNYRTWSCE